MKPTFINGFSNNFSGVKMNLKIFLSIIMLIMPAAASANVWFFYSVNCPHCHNVMQSGVLNNINASVENYLLDFSSENQEKFMQVVNQYNIPAGVPTALVFTDDWKNGRVIQGDRPIIDTLQSVVEEYSGIPSLNTTAENKTVSRVMQDGGVTKVERNVLSDLALVMGTGLADSVNPCIMAVLGLLFATLSSMKSDKKDMIILGGLYTLCVYVSYFIIGLVIFAGAIMLVNQFSFFAMNIMWIAKMLVAVFIVFAAAVNIKDFFWYGKGFTFKLNESQKNKVIKLIKKASIPAILLMGLFVTIVEFPCSGMMYLGIVTYFVSSGISPLLFLFYLILYNLLFITPLIIITLLFIKGKSAKSIETFRLKHRRQFRLIMGIGLLLLALLIVVV